MRAGAERMRSICWQRARIVSDVRGYPVQPHGRRPSKLSAHTPVLAPTRATHPHVSFTLTRRLPWHPPSKLACQRAAAARRVRQCDPWRQVYPGVQTWLQRYALQPVPGWLLGAILGGQLRQGPGLMPPHSFCAASHRRLPAPVPFFRAARPSVTCHYCPLNKRGGTSDRPRARHRCACPRLLNTSGSSWIATCPCVPSADTYSNAVV